MTLIDSVSSSVNYGATTATQTVRKIATNPSATKKALQICIKIFAAVDLYYGRGIQTRPITNAMKGTTDLVEFYGSFKNLEFWGYLFSKESIDQQLLLKSLKQTLSASHKDGKQIKQQQKVAQEVFNKVMAKAAYHSKGEVRKEIKAGLVEKGYDSQAAQHLANQVLIKQRSRPIIQLLTTACFTVTDLGSNLLTLKEWQVWDLAQLSEAANYLGTQSPVFLFVVNLGVKTTLTAVVMVGLTVSVGDACYRTTMSASKRYHAVTADDQKQANQEIRNAVLDLFSTGTELAAITAPLVFAVSPPALIALAVVAKGTGLVCILIR